MTRILVLCEKDHSAGLELLSTARKMAPHARLIALVEDGNEQTERMGEYGADEACVIPWHSDDTAAGDAIAESLRTIQPDIALFPATIRGRFLSAWTAARLDTGLTADCTDLQIGEDGLLKQIRPAFGGNLTAEILCRQRRPQMASVRPGVFVAEVLTPDQKIPIVRLTDHSCAFRLIRKEFHPVESGVSLQNARVIVAGGKGIGGAAGFQKLQMLADLLGGAVGATRSAVDAGWIGYEHQIGQTGVTVHPDLYIAFGISGMIQHTVGMNASKKVIAVNTDRNALIFRCADEGIVAGWEETADEMINMLQKGAEIHELQENLYPLRGLYPFVHDW